MPFIPFIPLVQRFFSRGLQPQTTGGLVDLTDKTKITHLGHLANSKDLDRARLLHTDDTTHRDGCLELSLVQPPEDPASAAVLLPNGSPGPICMLRFLPTGRDFTQGCWPWRRRYFKLKLGVCFYRVESELPLGLCRKGCRKWVPKKTHTAFHNRPLCLSPTLFTPEIGLLQTKYI